MNCRDMNPPRKELNCVNDEKFVRLDLLDTQLIEKTARLLVDSFFSMFKGISKDPEILCRLFLPCLQLDSTYVLLKENQVAGFIAVSDSRKRAIIIREDVCISIFGPVKGKMIAWQLHKILSVPAVTGTQSGYIDFIATAPEFRRQRVAERLLIFVESHCDFTELFLDVLIDNQPAVRLYEKLGYRVVCKKKSFLMRLAGVKTMVVMKKGLMVG